MPRLLPGGDLDLARRLAPNMREADKLEAARVHGLGPYEALALGLRNPRNAFWIADDSGEPAAMGGSHPFPDDPAIGCPWLLGTDFITRRRSWFLRNTPAIWAMAGQGFASLRNVTDARNRVHVRWLEWSGCRLGKTWDFHGNPFIEFVKPCASL